MATFTLRFQSRSFPISGLTLHNLPWYCYEHITLLSRLAGYYRSAIVSAPFAATALGLLIIVSLKLLELGQRKRSKDGELGICTAEDLPSNQSTYGVMDNTEQPAQ